MKLATTKDRTMLFHGNCKDSNIVDGIKATTNQITNLILTRGIYNHHAKDVRRYVKAIANSKDNYVLVTK